MNTKNNNQIGIIFWLLFDRAKKVNSNKTQTVSFFHQDKSIIERTPLEIQVEGIENGHRKTELMLNKEYKKQK
jgi:hypothetical protein